ncbi:MAG: thiamine-binding protein [Thermoproteota archaeon]|nr:thiamine-binding protein [Thermoproteota archaeon]
MHAAHNSAKSVGAKRIISTIRIDERLDKPNVLDDKVQSVTSKMS